MSTRPRIEFDENGVCNACLWAEQKKHIDWEARSMELDRIIAEHRDPKKPFDCVVPVSGGKDGTYVAYNLKHKYGLHPLTVTVRPPLERELGEENLRRFVNAGYDNVAVTPNPEVMREINRVGFVEMGFPYYGWLIAIFSTVIRIALAHDITLLFYAEDGEVEYGGSTENYDKAIFDLEYMKRAYFEGGYEKVFSKLARSKRELFYWTFPDDEEIAGKTLSMTHWSYFEPWDPYRNYLLAKEHTGLKEAEESNTGTFTNFAQNDQKLYALHTYLMYLKLGFGRATQDASIDIRRGAMDRDQGVNLVRLYDGQFPSECLEDYLEYYQMDEKEFFAVLDKWANRDLFEKVDGWWRPKFTVE
jgi:N-acetyl sugar amidotransferase